jgi:hypothetical protein
LLDIMSSDMLPKGFKNCRIDKEYVSEVTLSLVKPPDKGRSRLERHAGVTLRGIKSYGKGYLVMSTEHLETAPIIPGRTCKGCTLCCSLLLIRELDKPAFQHCPYVAVGKGCTAYSATGPVPCGAARRFDCKWRTDASLGKHWRPKICGMIIHAPRANELQIICSSKGAKLWRREPYWSEIQAMAKNAHERVNGYLLIIRKEGPMLAVNPFTNKSVAVRPVERCVPQDAQYYNRADWLARLIFLGYEPIG